MKKTLKRQEIVLHQIVFSKVSKVSFNLTSFYKKKVLHYVFGENVGRRVGESEGNDVVKNSVRRRSSTLNGNVVVST